MQVTCAQLGLYVPPPSNRRPPTLHARRCAPKERRQASGGSAPHRYPCTGAPLRYICTDAPLRYPRAGAPLRYPCTGGGRPQDTGGGRDAARRCGSVLAPDSCGRLHGAPGKGAGLRMRACGASLRNCAAPAKVCICNQ